MTKYLITDVKHSINTYQASVKKNIRPKTVKVKDNKGNIHNLGITEWYGLLQQKNIFQLKNGRLPKYISNTPKCSTLPIAMDYQDNGYTCCPTSLSMAIACLGGFKSEKQCANALGTVYGSGTDPSKLVSNAPKLGYKATPIKRDYQAVLESLQKGKPVIAHIQTRPATCLGYQGDYGHYILIYWCKKGMYYIADPTKGIKKCKASNIDKATNGRDIKYYSVGIK